MPHPEREHELMIEVAHLRREVEIAVQGLAKEKARADAAVECMETADAQRNNAADAFAAARRECEGLRTELEKAMGLIDQLRLYATDGDGLHGKSWDQRQSEIAAKVGEWR